MYRAPSSLYIHPSWYRREIENTDTDFQAMVHFGHYRFNRPWFWLPSENRVSARQSWGGNPGWWWHLWLSSEPTRGSAFIPGLGRNSFHSDKITHGMEVEHGYSWGVFRSFPAIRCFIVCIMFCFFKIFKVAEHLPNLLCVQRQSCMGMILMGSWYCWHWWSYQTRMMLRW